MCAQPENLKDRGTALPDGLPTQFQGEEGEARLESLLGIVNRRERQSLAACRSVRNAAAKQVGSKSATRRLGTREVIAVAYATGTFRSKLLRYWLTAVERDGSNVDTDYLPSLEFRALLKYRSDAWSRFDADPSEAAWELLGESREEVMASKCSGPVRSALSLWDEILSDLQRWGELDELYREKVLLSVFSMMAVCGNDQPIRQAIAHQPALEPALGHVLVDSSTREATEVEVEDEAEEPQLRLQQLSKAVAEVATSLADNTDFARLEEIPLLLREYAEELEEIVDQLPRPPAPPSDSWEFDLQAFGTLLEEISKQAQLSWLSPQRCEEVLLEWEQALRRCSSIDLTALLDALSVSRDRLATSSEARARALDERLHNSQEIAALSTDKTDSREEIADRIERLSTLQDRQSRLETELLAAEQSILEALYPPPFEGQMSDEHKIQAEPEAVAPSASDEGPEVEPPALPREESPHEKDEASEAVVKPPQVVEPERVGADPRVIARRFLNSQAPHRTPNNQAQADLLWAIVDRALLPIAYWYLYSLERAGQRARELPVPGLIQAALLATQITGFGTPSAALYAQTLGEMDMLATQRLLEEGEFLGLRALGIAASIQPSLFCPSSLSAQLLRASTRGLPEDFGRVLLEIAAFADQGINLTLEDLRGYQEKSSVGEELKALQQSAEEFRKRASRKHTGYIWACEAIRYAVTRGPLSIIIDAVVRNDLRRLEEAKGFLRNPAMLDFERLLQESLRAVQDAHTKSISTVVGHARQSFFRNCDEAIEFGRQWVELHERNQHRSDEQRQRKVITILNYLTTQLPRAIEHFRAIHGEATWLADHAGLQVGITALAHLQGVITNKAIGPVNEDIKTALDLPRRMLGQALDAEGVPGTAVAIARFAESGFDYAAWAREAMEDGNLGLAHDVIGEIRRLDGALFSLPELERELVSAATKHKAQVAQQLQRASHAIADAYYARLLDEDEYHNDVAMIEYCTDESDARSYPDLAEVYRHCHEIEERLHKRQETRLSELRRDRERLGDQASGSPRRGEIPEGWLEGLDRSLDEHNITVAEEYLGQFKAFIEQGEQLVDYSAGKLQALRDFLRAERPIYEALHGKSLRDIAHQVGKGKIVGGIDFSAIEDKPSEALRSLGALSTKTRQLSPAEIGHLYGVLGAVGFGFDVEWSRTLSENGPRSGNGMFAFTMRLRVGERESPYPEFGSQRGGRYHILLARKYRSFEDIGQFIDSIELTHQPMLVIMTVSLSPERRREWARFCHERRQSLPLVDPVVVMYSAAGKEEIRAETRLRRFWRLVLPFTYANPYLNTLRPPPDEMFFGREDDVADVIRQDGAAILYGGRQLGKSTILQQAERRFHRPAEHHYAWVRSIDPKVDGVPYESIERRFWEDMRDDIQRNKLLGAAPSVDSANVRTALRDLLLSDQQLRILVLLDEADKFLLADSRHDFGVFRGLRALSYDTQGRFKVVIAGLANVQRYANMPNFPLMQLGTIRRIGIMPTADAMRLIREPLAAAGYAFDDPRYVNRILAYTNQHPGLIQIFGHYLVEYLNGRAKAKAIQVPDYAITDEDISATYNRVDVRADIVDRFNLTLRLDPRYQVIAYGLILSDTGLNEFNVTQAYRIGEAYWVEEFAGMSVVRLRAILDEMVGLGVLTHRKGGGGEDLYRLRNTNVFRLLGGKEQMEAELADLKRMGEQNDPLQRHRRARDSSAKTPSRISIRWSPLSIGDELQILGRKVELWDQQAPVVSESGAFTVSCIFGSTALGLDDLATGLSTLSELEAKDTQHTFLEIPGNQVNTIASLRERFQKAMAKSGHEPVVILLNMPSGAEPGLHAEIVDYLYSLKPPSSEHVVRIALAFGPRATWEWLGSPDHVAMEREGIMLPLMRWSPSALVVLLGDLQMLDGPPQVQELERLTGGWYRLIRGFSKAKLHSATVVDRPEAVTEYVTKISPHVADEARAKGALTHLGLDDVEHASALLREINQIVGETQFDPEWVSMVAEETPHFQTLADEADRFIAWLQRLGVLVSCADGKLAIEPVVRTYLSKLTA